MEQKISEKKQVGKEFRFLLIADLAAIGMLAYIISEMFSYYRSLWIAGIVFATAVVTFTTTILIVYFLHIFDNYEEPEDEEMDDD